MPNAIQTRNQNTPAARAYQNMLANAGAPANSPCVGGIGAPHPVCPDCGSLLDLGAQQIEQEQMSNGQHIVIKQPATCPRCRSKHTATTHIKFACVVTPLAPKALQGKTPLALPADPVTLELEPSDDLDAEGREFIRQLQAATPNA